MLCERLLKTLRGQRACLAIKIHRTKRTPMASRDIGNMGERHFSAWCSSCGLSANRSEEDKNGWDFVLETPGVEQIGGDGQIDEPPFECKVQIKSTDKQDRHEDIVLDKLWRLVVYPYPAFIIFILITQLTPRSPAGAHKLVHRYQSAHGTQRHPVPERPFPA
jgi:hypothetical protein